MAQPENRSDTSGLTLLGKSGVPSQKKLETFPAPQGRHATHSRITFTAPEFTSFCPLTHQPDFGEVTVCYTPKEKCLESKSWKLYLQTFRDEGHFYEALASIILDDLVDVLDPVFLEVTVVQNPRGGIGLTTKLTYSQGSIR